MPEAIASLGEDQIRIPQQDMAQFEATFDQRTKVAGPACNVNCNHHHAGIHIDRSGDYANEPPAGHETHDHEDHVHSPGCGHVQHEQAHKHIDHHVHNATCGHVYHSEAKEHVDRGHEANRSDHHHESKHEHVHHPGCGHVMHEDVQEHIDTHHVHDAHCGHLHHSEAEAHVDYVEKSSHEAYSHSHNDEHVHGPGCGHVEFERAHERADHTKNHDHDHIPEARGAKKAEVHHAASSDNELAQLQHGAETIRQVASLQTQTVRGQAEQEASRVVKPETFIQTEANESIKQAGEASNSARITADARNATDDAAELRGETLTTNGLDDLESKSLLLAASETTDENTVTVLDRTKASDAGEGLEKLLVKNAPGPDKPDAVHTEAEGSTTSMSKAGADEAISPPDISGAVEHKTATATDEAINFMEQLPTLLSVDPGQEFDLESETAKRQLIAQKLITAEGQTGEQQSTETPTRALEVIEKQFRAVREAGGSNRHKVVDELHKTISMLHASLHKDTGEVNDTKISQEFLSLLTILGFEQPQETLNIYFREHGLNVLDDLLSRLLELLHQSRPMEAMTTFTQLFPAPLLDRQNPQGIGKAILALLANYTLVIFPRSM